MILDAIKEKVVGKKPKFTRSEVLAARPIRNPSVEWAREQREENDPVVALLKVPRRKDRWGELVARLFKLPDFRKLELDEIGSDVWDMCDGTTTVDAVTRAIAMKYRLNRRQAETSVTAYLRLLAERRLVALKIGKPATGTRASGKKRKTKPAGATAH